MAWRQQKGSILIWAIGMAWLGGTMGVAAPNISEAISSTFAHMDTLWASAIVELGNQEGFIAILIYILGLMGGYLSLPSQPYNVCGGRKKNIIPSWYCKDL